MSFLFNEMENKIKESIKHSQGSELVISDVKIKSKASKIGSSLPQLKTLSLTNCSLHNEDVSDLINSLPRLETLVFASNPKITKMPDAVPCLELVHLSVTSSELSDFPLAIWKLPNLKELDFSSNRLTQIVFPKGMREVKPLIFLNLSRNSLAKMPNEMGNILGRLEQLNLEYNKFEEFPIMVCQMIKLLSLNISNNQLLQIPEDIGRLRSLTELLAKSNNLKTLPTSIGTLSNLKTLSLCSNQITQLPSTVGALQKIVNLSLQHNALAQLPNVFNSFKSLTSLKLDHNILKRLPDGLGGIDTLTSLDVSHNQLETLPDDLENKNLAKLMADNNRIKSLPNMSKLSKLSVLSLHQNHFQEVEHFRHLAQLPIIRLTLENNPLPDEAKDYISRYGETAFIQQYFGKGVGETCNSPANVRSRTSTTDDKESKKSAFKEMFSSALDTIRTRSTSNRKLSSSEVSSPEIDKTGVTDFSNFSEDFEKLLDELEVPQEKRNEMRNMPPAAKTKLVMQYKMPDTKPGAVLMRKPSRSSGNAKQFVEGLKSGKMTTSEIVSLHLEFKSQSAQWASQIIEKEKLIPSLLSFIQSSSLKSRKAKDYDLIYECLRLLRTISKSNQWGKLLDANAALVILEDIDHPKLKIQNEVVQLLNKMGSVHSFYDQLLDSFTKFRAERGFPQRFSPLVDVLYRVCHHKSSGKNQSIEEMEEAILISPLKIACLSLINFIIGNSERIEERYLIRIEFLQLGVQVLCGMMKSDSKEVTNQIVTFHDSMDEDQQDLPRLLGSSEFSRLMDRIPLAPAVSPSLTSSGIGFSPTTSFNSPINEVNIFHVCNYVNVSAKFTTKVPYTSNASIASILDKLMRSFGIEEGNLSDLSLSATSVNGKTTDLVFSDINKTCESYRLEGEVRCELTFKPWMMDVKITCGKGGNLQMNPMTAHLNIETKVTMEVASVATKIAQAQYQKFYAKGMPLHSPDYTEQKHLATTEHFGLFWVAKNHRDPCFWLDDTEKLMKYGLNKRQGHVEVRLRPLGIQINYMEAPPRLLKFDQGLLVQQVLEQAANSMYVNPSRLQNFGLLYDPEDQDDENVGRNKIEWLDSKRILASYQFPQMVNLRIELNPISLPVKFSVLGKDGPTGNILIDFTNVFLVGDLYNEMQGTFRGIPAEICEVQMVLVLKDKKEIMLEPEQSLRDQNIPYNLVSLLEVRQRKVRPRTTAKDSDNIWSEPTNSNTIVYEKTGKNMIASGTIGKIIEHITSENEDASKALEVFLMMYPSFSNAKLVVQKLVERYQTPSSVKKNDQMLIHNRVCLVIRSLQLEPPSSPVYPLVREIVIKEKEGSLYISNSEILSQISSNFEKKGKGATGESILGKAHRKSVALPGLDLSNAITDGRKISPTSPRRITIKLGRGAVVSRNMNASNMGSLRNPVKMGDKPPPGPRPHKTTAPPTRPLTLTKGGSVRSPGITHSPPHSPDSDDQSGPSPWAGIKLKPTGGSLKSSASAPGSVVSAAAIFNQPTSPQSSPTPKSPTSERKEKEKEKEKNEKNSFLRKSSSARSSKREEALLDANNATWSPSKGKMAKSNSSFLGGDDTSGKRSFFNKMIGQKSLAAADNITFFEIYGKDAVRHLCHMSSVLYSDLKSSEFLKLCWSHPKTQHLAPSVLAMISLFNDVSSWIASCIVSETKLRDRAALYTSFIKIAKQLNKQQNYHLLVAFITGINNSAILRLRWTLKKVPARFKQELESLEALVSMEGSYKVYRNLLTTLQGPVVPYIGVTLQDLTFMEENPEKVGEQINFIKQRMVYGVISNLLQFQGRHYSYGENQEVEKFLSKLPRLEPKQIYEQSLLIEPRNATREEIK
eukprot:TRINITY_DN3005_c0_g1_i1.p1 TRINITY_DN3005_c0_g1~~TRINITY_DN3005_c0_g1_i1.p1  ORF type:complete len:1844 (-),score=610.62 TRINITY_DN3005_c0_g1_i1:47-5578(-)